MKILEPEVITKIRYTAGMRCWQEKGLKKKKITGVGEILEI